MGKFSIARALGCALALQLTAACASIISGTTQDVVVETAPRPGAECTLANGHGNWTVPSTPATAKIHRAYGDLLVNCTHREGDQASTSVPSKTGLPVFGNILLGGLIGITVDLVSGAAWDYPNVIKVDLTQSAGKFAPPAPSTPAPPTPAATVAFAPPAQPTPIAPRAAAATVPTSIATRPATVDSNADPRLRDLHDLRMAGLISTAEYERRVRFLKSRL
jgi:hypothetical protein